MTRTPPAARLRIVTATVVVTLLAAGCLGSPAEDSGRQETTSDPPPTGTEESFAARRTDTGPAAPVDYGNDDWFLLSTPRHPEGHIRSFRLTLPEGAVQPPDDRFPLPTLFLEVVPVQASLDPGDDWALLGFHDNDGEARLMFALIGPTTTEEDLSTDPPQRTTRAPPGGPGVMFYGGPGLASGDDVYFVLVGYGDTGEVGFALRTTMASGQAPPPAAEDIDAFMATEPDAPVAPAPLWDGTGAYLGYYAERLVPGEVERRHWTQNVDHETERYDPDQGGARAASRSIASTADAGEGWSLVYASHDAAAETMYWTLDIAAQTATTQANGVSGRDPVGVLETATGRANGLPLALFMADGDGESRVRFTIDGTTADVGEVTTVQHQRLPATLETILGVPSATAEGLYRGDADGLPWIGELPPV